MDIKCRPTDDYLAINHYSTFQAPFISLVETTLRNVKKEAPPSIHIEPLTKVKQELAQGMFIDRHMEVVGRILKSRLFNLRHETADILEYASQFRLNEELIKQINHHDYLVSNNFIHLARYGDITEFEGFLSPVIIELIKEDGHPKVMPALQERLRQEAAWLLELSLDPQVDGESACPRKKLL